MSKDLKEWIRNKKSTDWSENFDDRTKKEKNILICGTIRSEDYN